MSVRDLIPWNRESNFIPSIFRDGERDPFLSLHRDVNRLFDDVFRGFDGGPVMAHDVQARYWPSVEITDTENDVQVTAEIPGMDEKDIEVLLEDGVLTLRGEKRSESEDKNTKFSERFYGRFERRISLGFDVHDEDDNINAAFANGVLTVTIPKSVKAQSKAKRITVNGKS
jgi:HSP20 family protein